MMRRMAEIAVRFMLVAAASGSAFATDSGTIVCATCHPKETAQYLRTAMGQSMVAPAPLPAGKVTQERSGSVITIEQHDGRMFHSLAEQGLTAEYPIRYQIGGGLMARSYMVQIGDYLFESPATWFNSYGWDLSPGYINMPLLDFDREMDAQCLFCHTGNTRFADTDGHRLQSTVVTSISCDRCHGPSEAHVRHPSLNNIVNPAKLAHAERDSVCEQCHLEGTTRILNPGKTWDDYRPGQAVEATFATYLVAGGSTKDVIAVSQTEELAQSKCVRATAGKLWCGTCHNPHVEIVNRQREIRDICTSCHTTLSAAAHPPGQNECTSCHMPRSSTTDIPHAALTDHRILRYPGEMVDAPSKEARVVVWREPDPHVRSRDLALAEVLIGFSKNLPAIGAEGIQRLEAIPENEKQQDAAVLSDLEGLSLHRQNVQDALRSGKRIVELEPRSAKAAMNLGIVLKRSGDLTEAERQLARAIELDPSLKQAYGELAALYGAQGRTREMMDTIDRFLRWNPQDIAFRLQKARLAVQ